MQRAWAFPMGSVLIQHRFNKRNINLCLFFCYCCQIFLEDSEKQISVSFEGNRTPVCEASAAMCVGTDSVFIWLICDAESLDVVNVADITISHDFLGGNSPSLYMEYECDQGYDLHFLSNSAWLKVAIWYFCSAHFAVMKLAFDWVLWFPYVPLTIGRR